jgi:hypothetical protein
MRGHLDMESMMFTQKTLHSRDSVRDEKRRLGIFWTPTPLTAPHLVRL